jgi:hypothetical protein
VLVELRQQVTFFGAAARRYVISFRTGPRSQPLIVFLAKLVRRAISLIVNPSRNRILRTFAYIAMVCTSSSLQRPTASRNARKHPGQFSVSRTAPSWSVFNERQHRYAELTVWTGKHSLDLQVSVPSGRTAEAIKPDVIALANAILKKLP